MRQTETTELGIQAPSCATIVLVVFLGIGAFFRVTEHGARGDRAGVTF